MRGTFECSSKQLWKLCKTYSNLFRKLLGNGKLLIAAWFLLLLLLLEMPELAINLKNLKNTFDTWKNYQLHPDTTELWSLLCVMKWEDEKWTKTPLSERNVLYPQLEDITTIENDAILCFAGSWVAGVGGGYRGHCC